MSAHTEAQTEVAEAVRAVLAAGQARDFARLRAFHSDAAGFSRWSNRPGGPLLDLAAAHEEEEAAFSALHPGTRLSPEEIQVALYGTVAVSTFLLRISTADDRTLRRTRGTLIWQRTPTGWRIVHEHFSP